MIYTITLNPCLDYYVRVNNLKLGEVNRACGERLCLGGKGINVSLQLKELGDDTVAVAFCGGATGELIKAKLKEAGVQHLIFTANGQNRINVKIEDDKETDVNADGLNLTDGDILTMVSKLKSRLNSGDCVVLSGSVPNSLNEGAYAIIAQALQDVKGVRLVVDACGELLLNTLKYKPFLIKPNLAELCELFALPKISPEDVLPYAKKLKDAGAQNVMVTLGTDGSVLVTDEGCYRQSAVSGKAICCVGAGDSAVAGFLHEYEKTCDYEKALAFATACGSARAFAGDVADERSARELLLKAH